MAWSHDLNFSFQCFPLTARVPLFPVCRRFQINFPADPLLSAAAAGCDLMAGGVDFTRALYLFMHPRAEYLYIIYSDQKCTRPPAP